jgi:hypothetical protein
VEKLATLTVAYPRKPKPNKKTGAHIMQHRFFYFGGAMGDRTPDLNNAIVALSQLSYDPKTCGLAFYHH